MWKCAAVFFCFFYIYIYKQAGIIHSDTIFSILLNIFLPLVVTFGDIFASRCSFPPRQCHGKHKSFLKSAPDTETSFTHRLAVFSEPDVCYYSRISSCDRFVAWKWSYCGSHLWTSGCCCGTQVHQWRPDGLLWSEPSFCLCLCLCLGASKIRTAVWPVSSSPRWWMGIARRFI